MLRRHRRLLIGVALVVIALAVAIGVYAYNENQPLEKRGSATEEFVVTEEPEPPPPPPDKEIARPWPTYGYDIARQHISPYKQRPPFRRLWKIDAHDTLEFPPTIGYGRMYLAQQKGLFFALDVKTGKVDWKKSHRPLCSLVARRSARASSTSPTCTRWSACRTRRGRTATSSPGTPRRAVSCGATIRRRSSPRRCSANNTLYVGTWNNDVIALNAKTGRASGASRPTTRSTPRPLTGRAASSSPPTAARSTR